MLQHISYIKYTFLAHFFDFFASFIFQEIRIGRIWFPLVQILLLILIRAILEKSVNDRKES